MSEEEQKPEKELEYQETLENYNRGVEWHEEKSDTYDWSAQMDQFIRLLPGKRVLDAGAGTGRDVPLFIDRGMGVEALDYSEKSLNRISNKYPDVPVHQADFRSDLPLHEGQYDGIWACASLLNLKKEDIPHALTEFNRLLVQDGGLFISVKEGADERMVDDKEGRRLFSFFTPEEIRGVVEAAGFEVTQTMVIPDAELTDGEPADAKPNWICVFAKKTA